MPPGSSYSTLQSSCLQIPSNPYELKRHSTTVKKRLDLLFSSPLNLTLVKLNQGYKSCKVAQYNTTLLVQENMELCTAIQKEYNKCKCSKKLIREEASLIREEVQSLLDESNTTNQLAGELLHRHVPLRYSNCNTLGHNRRRCPNRTN